MGLHTPLYDLHVALGARMVDLCGWDVPLHYGSQVDEHHQVRSDCGVFDVSHMTIIDVFGSGAADWLRYLLANDVERLLVDGRAQYSAMLNEEGGVIDDLLVYRNDPGFRLVVNAATCARDLDWMQAHMAGFDVQISERGDLSMLAIQGPQALERCTALVSPERASLIRQLAPFHAARDGNWFIARTGYTGEDGLEIMLPADEAPALFNELLGAGIAPVGLGARDTLRLEAGMYLHGQDLDEGSSPLESNLDWTVAWEPAERQFIGRSALERQRDAGACRRLVGLVLEDRAVLRPHLPVRTESGALGEITSGNFSPTLGKSVALARVPADCGERAEVQIRDKWYPVRVVRPRFVRRGQALI